MVKKVVVIGSNSFSGAHFISLLLEKTEYEVIGIDRVDKSSIFLPYKGKEQGRFRYFNMDLNNDMENMLGLFEMIKPEYIVNFAAQSEVGPSWENPSHWFKTNTLAIVNLTNSLNGKEWLKNYVQISTPEIYGSCEEITEQAPYNPSTPYAASKAAGDMFIQTLIKNFNFPATFIRSTNVYGPGQQLFKIIPRAIIYMKLGKTISLHGGGEAVKSYIHIRDVCEGILRAMETQGKGEIYHLSPESGYSIKSIVKKIADKMGKIFQEVTEIVGERLGQDKAYVIKSDKAKAELGWSPEISLEQGLDECIEWVNDNWEIIQALPLDYIHKE